MRRDGSQKSIWQEEAEFSSGSQTFPAAPVDVVVVGGGITGISIAFRLQQNGLRCVVAEAAGLCYGTTGGTTSHLNNFFDATYAEIEKKHGATAAVELANAATRAVGNYRATVAALSIDCGLVDNEGTLFAKDDKQEVQLRSILEASLKAGIPVREAEHKTSPVPGTSAIVYPDQAQINPVKYVHALAAAFEKNGGIILQNCRATDAEEKEIIEVHTSLGTIQTRILVYATHTVPGISMLDFRLSPWRSYVIACRLKGEVKSFGPAYDLDDPYHYYRMQEVNGEQLLLAGGNDHPTGKGPGEHQAFQELENHVAQYFSEAEVLYRWSSQYYDPADGLAYIGRMPGGSKHQFVATGFAGNGMTWSQIAVEVIEGLINDQETALAKLLSPSRFKLTAEISAELTSALAVAQSFVGDRFRMEKTTAELGLQPGQGKIIRNEGQSIAVCCTPDGVTHSVSAVCTHMKCLVHWNADEISWDCPCHGARFAPDGKLLNGPAVIDLAQAEIHESV